MLSWSRTRSSLCTAVCRRKSLQSVGDQIHRAIISVLLRCEGSAKGNATDVRMQHSAETVRTARLAQLSRSNHSSANSAYSATEAVFKETMWVRRTCDAHMSKGGSAPLREACALSVRYREQRNVRMGAWHIARSQGEERRPWLGRTTKSHCAERWGEGKAGSLPQLSSLATGPRHNVSERRNARNNCQCYYPNWESKSLPGKRIVSTHEQPANNWQSVGQRVGFTTSVVNACQSLMSHNDGEVLHMSQLEIGQSGTNWPSTWIESDKKGETKEIDGFQWRKGWGKWTIGYDFYCKFETTTTFLKSPFNLSSANSQFLFRKRETKKWKCVQYDLWSGFGIQNKINQSSKLITFIHP